MSLEERFASALELSGEKCLAELDALVHATVDMKELTAESIKVSISIFTLDSGFLRPEIGLVMVMVTVTTRLGEEEEECIFPPPLSQLGLSTLLCSCCSFWIRFRSRSRPS